jgi:hypothetical protein
LEERSLRLDASPPRVGWRRPPWERSVSHRSARPSSRSNPGECDMLGVTWWFQRGTPARSPPHWWPWQRDATRRSCSAPGVIARAPATPRRTGGRGEGATLSVHGRGATAEAKGDAFGPGSWLVAVGPWRTRPRACSCVWAWTQRIVFDVHLVFLLHPLIENKYR